MGSVKLTIPRGTENSCGILAAFESRTKKWIIVGKPKKESRIVNICDCWNPYFADRLAFNLDRGNQSSKEQKDQFSRPLKATSKHDLSQKESLL